MTEIFILICLVLIAIVIVLLLIINKKITNSSSNEVSNKLLEYEKYLNKFESLIKEEFSRNREELNKTSKNSREELNNSFKNFTDSLEQRLKNIQEGVLSSSKDNRTELGTSLKTFEERFTQNVKDFNSLQKEKFDTLIQKQEELTLKTENKLDKQKETIEQKLKSIQDDNNIKLEKMRETVDEKLHKTLETRLGESFKLVSERLELVQKGLGEMQTLATGVGDLKKVLSNVKTRGVLGEYQLENILEQLLTRDQYEKNVKTNRNSNDIVEFAVKLPSKDSSDRYIWLPLDAKFPSEDYEQLINSYELADLQGVEKSKKSLEQRIKSFAKDIKTKYIDPPNTTDFGIMFLPFEGLYAEVLRIPGLFETIQRDYRITITGPTTISAFLSSLQMGFRSLAVEKRTSEIWELLGVVRTEFGKFGTVLDNTKKKLEAATKEIDNASTRTRVMERKLKDVEALPQEDTIRLLGSNFSKEDDE